MVQKIQLKQMEDKLTCSLWSNAMDLDIQCAGYPFCNEIMPSMVITF